MKTFTKITLENGQHLLMAHDDSGERDGVWIETGLASIFLGPKDIGRFIAALARMKAAREARRA